ncbi:MAG: FAD-dependent oxidoreductase [Succiniclasticum sp.]
MSRKYVIIGGVAGGASAAARLRRLDEDAQIIMLEKGPYVSFSNCSIPYYLNRLVPESGNLVLMNPERFRKQYNIDARTEHEATAIDRQRKVVTVRNVRTGETYEENYDKLVLAPGGTPIRPRSIQGIDGANVFTIHTVPDVVKLDACLRKHPGGRVVIVGGGFIGCEAAECLQEAGYDVSIVEAADQILAPYDFDLVQLLHKELLDHGIHLILQDGLAAVTETGVTLQSGRTLEADAVLLAIGVAPDTRLAREAGLEIGPTGGIRTDGNGRTSDENIYAVGDAVEVLHRLTHKPMRLALAWPAQMEARNAADAICGESHERKGFLGSSVVRVFSLYAARTGLNEKEATQAGIDWEYAYVIPMDKVGVLPGARPIHLKVLFEKVTGRLLGAQAIGGEGAVRRIHVVAALLGMNGTLADLRDAELCYAPVTATAKDAVNLAGLVGLNLLYGRFRQVHLTRVRELVEQGAYILDVREENEFAAGHLLHAVNIPLSQLRARLDEIPRDRPVYVHCRSSQRSYNAVCALQQRGWHNVYNIAGSYLAISLYEAMQERLYGKEKIVTEYNFR